MEKQAQRPVGRTLWVAALAVLAALAVRAALVAAVSAFAGDGSGTAVDAPAAWQRQTEPVQDSQAAPALEQGEPPAPGGRDDCPEREGDRRPEDQSAAPGSGTTTPSPDV